MRITFHDLVKKLDSLNMEAPLADLFLSDLSQFEEPTPLVRPWGWELMNVVNLHEIF